MHKILTNKAYLIKDVIKIYLLYFFSIIIIYKFPQQISFLYQIILLFLFWRSPKNYFWLAFIFIIQSYPGAFFIKSDITHSFALWQNTTFGILYFWIMFILIGFIKALKIKNNYPLFLMNNIYLLIFYLVILLVLFGFYKLPTIIRKLLPWLSLFIIPRFLRDEKDYRSFFNLVYSFVVFTFLSQLFFLFKGYNLSVLFGGISDSSMSEKTIEEVGQALRPVSGILIPYLSIWGSVFYLIYKKNSFSKNYLFVVLTLSLFSIFITATRSWLISSIFIIIIYLLIYTKNLLKVILGFILGALFIILLSYIPALKKQSDFAMERYDTVLLLTKGDITAGGTINRFNERGPRVMKKFRESPIIGWGYGNTANIYGDGHVGYQNLLLHTGIIGFILFLTLWFSYIFKMVNLNNILAKVNPYKNIPLILVSFLLGILIINTTAQWFGYLVQFTTGFTIAFLFSWANFIYYDSLLKNKIIRKSNKMSI